MANTTEQEEITAVNLSSSVDSRNSATVENHDTSDIITFSIIVILIINGVFGNFISLAVLLRKKFRKTSTGVYLIALNITDTICLVIPFLDALVQSPIWLSLDIEHLNNNICVFFNYFIYWIPHTNVWITVIISVERLGACIAPHR